MSEPGEETSPSQILVARREAMNRRWNAELASFGRGPSAFPPWQELASWLVEQLPGSDPWLMGWGMINVTFMLYPPEYNPDISDNDEPAGWSRGQSRGLSIGLVGAAQVGEGLIGLERRSVAPVSSGFDISRELAKVGHEIKLADGDPHSNWLSTFRTDGRGVAAEIQRELQHELPTADPRPIGWALRATAMLLAQQTINAKKQRQFGRRARTLRGLQDGNMAAAVMLDFIGQDLARDHRAA
jgi:hypothetical protein